MKMKNPPPGSIGLCFSGGGFRASLFHLGVLRYLAETKQLSNVGVISSVSGGSIIAAFLASRWGTLQKDKFSLKVFLKEVYTPFVKLITRGNLRNRWLLLCLLTLIRLLDPRFTWIKLWVGFFDRWFYGRKNLKMTELAEGLQLVINTTDLHAGKAYRFSHNFHGSDDDGYTDSYGKHPVLVAEAATASAAHLPFYRRVGAKSGRWFLDGGCFDNCGLDWFLDWEDKKRPPSAIKPTFLIVSEASSELTEWKWGWRRFIPLYRMIHVLRQYRSIQYEQTRRIRKDWFIDRVREIKKEKGIIISIDDVVEELRKPRASSDLIAHSLPEQLVNEVQRIRTDLDNFLPEEAKLLSYHSYQLTHTLLTIYYDSEKIKNHPVSIKEPQWKLKFTKNKLKRYNKTLWRCDKRFAWKRRPW